MKTKNRYELTKTKYLLDSEVEHLNAVLSRFSETDPRDTAIISLLLYTGARAQEALNIKAEDLDPSEQTVFIRGLKGSDNREVALPPWLFKQIQTLVTDDGSIFKINYLKLWRIWRNYRPVKKNLHSLRHTFAINFYRKSKDLLLLKSMLGHRSISNTMIYSTYQHKTVESRKTLLTLYK